MLCNHRFHFCCVYKTKELTEFNFCSAWRLNQRGWGTALQFLNGNRGLQVLAGPQIPSQRNVSSLRTLNIFVHDVARGQWHIRH